MNALLLPCPGLLARPMAAYGQSRGDQARKTFLLSLAKVSLFPRKACLSPIKVSLFPRKACLSLTKVSLFPRKACLSPTKVSLFSAKACLSLTKVSLFPRKACLSLTKVSLFLRKACLSLTKVSLFPARACWWDLFVLPGGGTASQIFKEAPHGAGMLPCLSRAELLSFPQAARTAVGLLPPRRLDAGCRRNMNRDSAT